jgi:hypothetical protein
VLKLLAFVLPLGLDSFAVAAAIGTSQDTAMAQWLRVSLIFVLLEGGMPLIGLGLGASSASAGWAREKRKSTAGMRHPRRTGRRPRARTTAALSPLRRRR